MEKELCNIFRVRGGIGDSWLASCKLKTIAEQDKNIKNIIIISGQTISVDNIMEVYKYTTFIDQIIIDPILSRNFRNETFDKSSPIFKICSKFHPESKKYDLNYKSNLMNEIKSTRLTLDEIQMNNIKTQDYICLHPRSRYNGGRNRRDWNSFLEFAKIIYDITNYKSFLLGSKNDGLENIKEKYIINVAGKTTIRESMQLILNSRAMVGTSSWSPLFSSIFKIPSVILVDQFTAVATPTFLQFFKDMGGDYMEPLQNANKNPTLLANKFLLKLR